MLHNKSGSCFGEQAKQSNEVRRYLITQLSILLSLLDTVIHVDDTSTRIQMYQFISSIVTGNDNDNMNTYEILLVSHLSQALLTNVTRLNQKKTTKKENQKKKKQMILVLKMKPTTTTKTKTKRTRRRTKKKKI